MPPKGPTSIRLSPEIKQALQVIANYEYRNPSNMIEFLIVERCRVMGIEIGAAESKNANAAKPRVSRKQKKSQDSN